jgi:hypothetical protein
MTRAAAPLHRMSAAGRADPFGLLVLGVVLALLVTIAIQAQASLGSGPQPAAAVFCTPPCGTADRPH